ncbi:MAG: O-antigen ligase family protein [Acidobacteria bacterium]|nr:O-antigen ligase family protein [Acidobacteriota bacterium]
MHWVDTSTEIPQSWSWKVCVLIAAIAVTLDVLIVQSPVVWLGMAGILAVLAQFRSPLSGLAVVIFTCGLLNYSPFESGPLSRLYPGNVAIGIFLLAWIMTSTWSPRTLFPALAVRGPLLSMAAVAPLSMMWSRLHPDPEVTYSFPHSDVSWATAQASQLVLLAATIGIPFAVSAGIKRWKDVETVVIMIGAVAAVGTLLTAGGLIFGYGGSFSILGATRGYWGQPWDSSMEPLTALCLPFLYAGVLFGRGWLSRYRLVCVLFFLCLLGVVLTVSRASWLLAFCGLLLVSASWLRRRVNPVLRLFITVFATVAITFSGAIGLVSHFYNPDEVYGLERIYYYATALQLFATHPLLGVGAGNYQFFDRSYEGEAAGGIAHNQFLTVAAETGVVGLTMLLWLVVALLRVRRQLRFVGEPLDDSHEWLKAAGSAFVLVWIAECFFQEAFFATAAAGGGMRVLTVTVYPWTLFGVLLAACRLSQTTALIDN